MTLDHANQILDRIREGQAMPLSVTNRALQRTGDICGLSSQPLRLVSNEQSHDRPREIHVQETEVGFSYSRYLDCQTNKGIKC